MPSSFARGNRLILSGIILLIFGTTSIGIWLYLVPPTVKDDALLKRMFEQVGLITSYAQSVETAITLSDRELMVRGEYYLNGPQNRFESIATTTLRIPEGKNVEEHSFTLRNISINDDIYTKIETESPALKKTIPHSSEWRHFTKNQIPDAFADIAVSGPTLDNLLLFSGSGAYLELVEARGEEAVSDERLVHYRFRLSQSLPQLGGTLETLMGRIGRDGHVDVWIDPESAMVRHAAFVGENYHSTTTFSAMNISREIEAPLP
ncbi:MAG: hypothetical protein WAZ27_03875 [Minisyncoccia bacterium]